MDFARGALLTAALTLLPAAASAQGTPAPPDAYLYFVWPQDGATIKGGFWARFGLRNMGVTQAGSDAPNARHQRADPAGQVPPAFRCRPDRDAHRIATRQAHASARAGRRQALPLQSADR